MYVMTEVHCQKCKLLKQMLGEQAMTIQFKLASENMDVCRELEIKSVPALVKDDGTVIFELEDIVDEIEKAK